MTHAVSHSRSFDDLIASREARIGIVGLGYAGLPLGLAFADAGFSVVGIDVSDERVSAVREHRSYLADVTPERYASVDGRLSATTDHSAAAEMDAVTICVPTPLSKTRTPDLSYVIEATESIAAHMHRGQLIVLQSTTYPGTTEEVVLPILERSGGRVGEDFFLGYAPERVDPGNPDYTIRTTPKLVSGVTDECLRRTQLLYGGVIETVIPTSSTIVAETAKLHENTFRAVNIALANELALMCDRMGISAWEVIAAASSKPYGFMPHYPGPGLGGDCIPVVPHFLASRLREYGYTARLIDAAHEINAHMPVYVLQRIADALNESSRSIKGARVLLLGVAYKAGVSDIRESPSLEVMRQLILRGADIRYCDPHVPALELDGEVHRSVSWARDEVEPADCVVLLTAHPQFLEQPLWEHARLVVDARNAAPDGPGVHRI